MNRIVLIRIAASLVLATAVYWLSGAATPFVACFWLSYLVVTFKPVRDFCIRAVAALVAVGLIWRIIF